MRSIKTLALASSSFYRIFIEYQSSILAHTLFKEIGSELLPNAFVVLQASQIKPWSRAAVREYLRGFPQKFDSSLPNKWTLSEALRRTKLHRCVQHFSNDFVAFALSGIQQLHHQSTASLTPSPTELHRIQRSFYIFELYCHLFRKQNGKLEKVRLNEKEQRHIFFNKFPPWENEQLGCIHDYLYERFTVPFNDIAEHDVDWEYIFVPWANHYGRREIATKESYLSQGLEFLHGVITTRDYWDRWKMISPRIDLDSKFLFHNILS